MSQNRYDTLRERIGRQFSRAFTLRPDIDGETTETLVNLDDHDELYALTERQEKFGPFNSVFVNNRGGQDARFHLDPQRTVSVTVPDGGTTAQILDQVPVRYVRYLAIENLDTDPFDGRGVEVTIGNEVDQVELDLLRDGGMLNIKE